jgi:hypothetical protein
MRIFEVQVNVNVQKQLKRWRGHECLRWQNLESVGMFGLNWKMRAGL